VSPATARPITAPRRSTRQEPRRRPDLGVVRRSTSTRRRRFPEIVAITVVVLTLLAIVISNSVLAQGQLHLGRIQASLSEEQAVHRATVLQVAQLETPARIAAAAGTMHLVQPSQVLQLPTVPLDQPLPPVKITPAPAH